MIEIRYPDTATLYQSPCAKCDKRCAPTEAEADSLLVSCNTQLCYEVNEFLQNHPTVDITSK